MQFRQGFRQRKPAPCTRFPRFYLVIRLDEWLQNAGQIRIGDADAPIDNRDFCPSPLKQLHYLI